MNNNNTTSNIKIEYASLQEQQEKRLREMEKQFNNEFGTNHYLMVMQKAY